jgi:rubrerythrin
MSTNGTPQSGTKDKNYNLITVTHLCLEHVRRLDQYAQDAEREGDDDLASLFRRMQEHSRKGAEESKKPLVTRLSSEELCPTQRICLSVARQSP